MLHGIAIISVVYQNYSVLHDFLNSCAAQTSTVPFHIFIADLSIVKKAISEERLPITVTSSENKGYAHGVNVAIREAEKQGYTSFCVVNNDTYVAPDFIEMVAKSLNNHPHSLIGGKIYYAPGYEFHKDRYAKEEIGKIFWYAGGMYSPEHALVAHRGVDEVDHQQYDSLEKTDFITGCLICYDSSVKNEVGEWDESYFLYFEDADYCERAKQKKISLYYDPTLVMWHKNAQSTEGSGSSLHDKYLKKNQILFALKYAPLRTKLHVLKNYAATFFSRQIKK
ncbi:glycosyltransferase family 2 protein [Candidatus Roizmanbacteria bacterium]|nr:glycosyltransferase family 2 protein [Candidatus Roizmanbacteria bacterium]